LAFVLYFGAKAQCALSLSGQVTDLDDGQELEYSIVTLAELNQTTTTNRHGRFVFNNLCAGNYKLLVQHFGCKDTVITVQLQQSVKLQIRLPHSAFELTEVDVMDKRKEMRNTQVVSELSGAELDKTKGQSLGDALKNITGVTTFNTGATISRPMIHGMQGYRILILNNGIRQEGQQWGNEHAPEIDPFIAKKLSVIKGANSIRYGSDAIAGVILVEPGDLPDTASVTGEVNLAGFSNGKTGAASAILNGYFDRLKNFNWRVQGTYKRGGTVRTPSYFLSNTGIEEKNFSYTLGYHYKKVGVEVYYSQFNTIVGVYKGAHAGNLTDLKNAYNRSKPLDSLAAFSYEIDKPYQDIAHELAKANAHYHFAARWRLKLQYAWQYNIRKEYDLHVPLSQQSNVKPVADLDYRITSQTMEGLIEHDNIRSFRGQFGASFMHQSNVYLGRFFIPNFLNNTWGTFLTERYVKQHFEFEAGLRYDSKSLQSYYYNNNQLVSPLLKFENITYNSGIIWKPDTTFNLLGNVGSAWRAPAPNELYSNGIHHGVGAIERGNSDLKSERVYNVTVSAILKRKRISAEIGAYVNKFENYIYLDPSGKSELTIRGAFPVFNYLQADANISGIDAQVNLKIFSHLHLIAKGMWVRGWNESINDHLVYMPSDRGEVQLKYEFDFKQLLKENYVQMNAQYVCKQWRIPEGGDFASPPGEYLLAGVEAGTKITMGKQALYVGFSVTNLLNTVYRDYLDRFRYYADAQGRSYNVRLRIPLTIYDKK